MKELIDLAPLSPWRKSGLPMYEALYLVSCSYL